MSEVVAIIPARGGSKGILRKNMIQLCGKPLIAWSIEAAKAAKSVHRIVVSTDDTEISAIAQEYGAEVVLRPAEISGDEAASETALLHVLNHLRETEGYKPDLVVFLQATSPCRKAGTIDDLVENLKKSQADSCFSTCTEHFTGRWRISDDGIPHPVNFELSNRPRRQDYPIEYLENGSI